MAAKKLCAMCAMYLQNVFYGDYSAQDNQQTYVNVHLYYWNVSINLYTENFLHQSWNCPILYCNQKTYEIRQTITNVGSL